MPNVRRVFEYHASPVRRGGEPYAAMSIRDLRAGFMAESSLHPVRRLLAARGGCKTVFWSVALVAGLVLFSILSYFCVTRYLEYPVSASTQVFSARSSPLPAVTVCPTSPATRSRLQNLLPPATSSYTGLAVQDVDSINQDLVTPSAPVSGSVAYNDSQTTEYTTAAAAAAFRWELWLRETLASAGSVPPDRGADMVRACAVRVGSSGGNCSLRQLLHPLHGDCYTVTAPDDNATWTTAAARSDGFSLILDTQQDEAVGPALAAAAGMWVIVHHPDTTPHPTQQGVLVSAGKITQVTVEKHTHNRLQSPHGGCRPSRSNDDVIRDVYAELFGTQYSRQGCMETCYQNHLISRCNCSDALINLEAPFNVCRHDIPKEAACKSDVFRQFSAGDLRCEQQCPQACTEHMYEPSLSAATWPSKVHLPELWAAFPRLAGGGERAYRANLARVHVHYSGRDTTTTEHQHYPLPILLANLAGLLAFIGVSLSLPFEVGELALDCLWLGIARCRRPLPCQGQDAGQPTGGNGHACASHTDGIHRAVNRDVDVNRVSHLESGVQTCLGGALPLGGNGRPEASVGNARIRNGFGGQAHDCRTRRKDTGVHTCRCCGLPLGGNGRPEVGNAIMQNGFVGEPQTNSASGKGKAVQTCHGCGLPLRGCGRRRRGAVLVGDFTHPRQNMRSTAVQTSQGQKENGAEYARQSNRNPTSNHDDTNARSEAPPRSFTTTPKDRVCIVEARPVSNATSPNVLPTEHFPASRQSRASYPDSDAHRSSGQSKCQQVRLQRRVSHDDAPTSAVHRNASTTRRGSHDPPVGGWSRRRSSLPLPWRTSRSMPRASTLACSQLAQTDDNVTPHVDTPTVHAVYTVSW